MRVSQAVLAVLDQARCIGTTLSIAHLGQLERKLYVETNKVLEAAGGKWNRKAQAHLFDGDAAEAIEPIILTGEIVSQKVEFQQFDTPPDLAARVVAEARIEPGMGVLEPSAGLGNLAIPAAAAGGLVFCYELDWKRADKLVSASHIAPSRLDMVVSLDFLEQEPGRYFDRVVMNPPFTRGQDVRHVTHAVQFLKPGGRLVAIMSASIRFRQEPLFAEFRALLERHNATVEDLPAGSFKASGTGVNACLVSFDVEA